MDAKHPRLRQAFREQLADSLRKPLPRLTRRRVVSEYGRAFPDADDAASVVWHFDEIQVVPGWERFVRRLLDAECTEVIVTGSSAALLSREGATALRGRGWRVLIRPFSFDEALRHQGRALPDDATVLTGRERTRLERALLDWLGTGGFPEAQGLDAPSRHQLLRDYVDVATTSSGTWKTVSSCGSCGWNRRRNVSVWSIHARRIRSTRG